MCVSPPSCIRYVNRGVAFCLGAFVKKHARDTAVCLITDGLLAAWADLNPLFRVLCAHCLSKRFRYFCFRWHRAWQPFCAGEGCQS